MAVNRAATAAILERGKGAELFEARIDLRPLKRPEAFHAELLTAETSHDGAVDHRAAQLAPADVILFQIEALLGEIADEAARETIARASGIEDRLQQIPGHGEIGVFAEQH